jgi:hypothetical protein
MKKLAFYFLGFFLLIVIGFFALGYLSSWVGWYGYEKWKDRKYSDNISESKKRGVFVKELHYQIENHSGREFPFEVFLEKAYKYGRHTSEETVVEVNSNFPFQISFPYRPTDSIAIRVKEGQHAKFDSSGFSFRQAQLSDTIVLEILGRDAGIIKVW